MYHVQLITKENLTIIVPKSKLILYAKGEENFVEISGKTYSITTDEAFCLQHEIREKDEELSEAICKIRNSFDPESTTRMKVVSMPIY